MKKLEVKEVKHNREDLYNISDEVRANVLKRYGIKNPVTRGFCPVCSGVLITEEDVYEDTRFDMVHCSKCIFYEDDNTSFRESLKLTSHAYACLLIAIKEHSLDISDTESIFYAMIKHYAEEQFTTAYALKTLYEKTIETFAIEGECRLLRDVKKLKL